MKELGEIIAIVIDYGYYASLAERMAEDCKKVYYYSPCEAEFVDINRCVYGDGLQKVERCDDWMRPEILDTIDLFVFPDIGFEGLQAHLKSLGKAVWGSFDATNLEIYRTRFVDMLKELGLPMIQSVKVTGLTALAERLKLVDDKWVKINRYRAQMETWHHIDYQHSQRDFERLAKDFGAAKEHIKFVVQDSIPSEIEIGYDGWSVDGQFPESSYAGYEGKNEIYLGSLRKYTQLPKQVTQINEAIAPLLKEFGYRNFIATEIRVGKDGKSYFIDPTMRMPGQTGEQLLETCGNISDVIWRGANGILIKPEFKYKFSASATIHYDAGLENEWKTISVPMQVRKWAKLSHYCIIDGMYQFPPCHTRELGVVIGAGNSIEQAFATLKKNIDAFKAEPVSFQLDGFFDLLDTIKEAQKKGMIFTDSPIPSKEAILKYTL